MDLPSRWFLVLMCFGVTFREHTCYAQQCTTSNLDQNKVDQQQIAAAERLNDEDHLSDFKLWGTICCHKNGVDFRIEPAPNSQSGEVSYCNSPDQNIQDFLQFQVDRAEGSIGKECFDDFIPCEISVKGDLKGYFDRRRNCTYSPFLMLYCGDQYPHDAVRGSFIDKNTAPRWSLPGISLTVSEFARAGTLVLSPKPSYLNVSELSDIWGSQNWEITLSLWDSIEPGPGKLTLDTDLTIYATPNNPPAPDRETTMPALRLTHEIPYESCQHLPKPCTFTINLTATNLVDGLSAESTIILTVTDENNLPPKFEKDYSVTAFQIGEDDDADTASSKLPKIVAKDQDTGIGCLIRYTLESHNDLFSISEHTGTLSRIAAISWKEDGTNIYILNVVASEDSSSGSKKCDSAMTATAVVTVEVTSQRSVPLKVVTEPSILTAVKYGASEEIVGQIRANRSGVAVAPADLRFRVIDPVNLFTVSPEGSLRTVVDAYIERSTTVEVEISDGKGRPLTTQKLTVVAEDPPAPQFKETLYKLDIYDGLNFFFNFADEVSSCKDCVCGYHDNYSELLPGVDSWLDGTQTLTISSWSADVLSKGFYRSILDITCNSTVSPISAQALIIINWHPLPQFYQMEPILVKENTSYVGDVVIGTVQLKNRFPYYLEYYIDDPVVDFNITENGRLHLLAPLNFAKEPTYNLTVLAYEPGMIDKAVKLYVPIEVLPRENRPAQFQAVGEVTAYCDDSSVQLTINVGDQEFEKLNMAGLGDNAKCLDLVRSPSEPSVVLSPSMLIDHCAESFTVIISLTGPNTKDFVTVNYSGCSGPPEVMAPTFTAVSYTGHVYPYNLPGIINADPVANCPDCSCAITGNGGPGVDKVAVNESFGQVTVAEWPIEMEFNDGRFIASLLVTCKSLQTALSATVPVQVYWHPKPNFDVVETPLIIPENTTLGTTLGTVRSKHPFIYPLEFSVSPGSPVDVTSGIIRLIQELSYQNKPYFEVNVTVQEVGRPETQVFVILPVKVLEKDFQSARFAEREMIMPCSANVVILIVDIGDESFAALEFDTLGDKGGCLEIQDNAESETVIASRLQHDDCGSKLITSVVTLLGSRSKDMVVVIFEECLTTPVATESSTAASTTMSTIIPTTTINFRPPLFDQPFYSLHLYVDKDRFPVEIPSQVRSCGSCVCAHREDGLLLPDVIQVDPSSGNVTISNWPSDDVFTKGQYRSGLLITCNNTEIGLFATLPVIINWHPKAAFDRCVTLLVPENTTAGTELGNICPKNAFPYPLLYHVPDGSPIDVIGETIVLNRTLAYNTGSFFEINITARERGQDCCTEVRLTIAIKVLEKYFQPARFEAQGTVSVSCMVTDKFLLVLPGDELFANLTFLKHGDTQNCLRLQKDMDFQVVSIARGDHGDCGSREIVAAVSLEGKRSQDSVVLVFEECQTTALTTLTTAEPISNTSAATTTLTTPTELQQPSFAEPFYASELYNHTIFPVNVSTSVRNCQNCACGYRQNGLHASGLLNLNSHNGIVSINGWPSDAEFTAGHYRSSLLVTCNSTVTGLLASVPVVISWHPRPHFDEQQPFYIPESTIIGTVITFLRPKYRYPYPLMFTIPTGLPVTVQNDTLIVSAPLNYRVNNSYEIRVSVTEVGQSTEEITDIITIHLNIFEPDFVPSRFKDRTMVSVPCSTVVQELTVESGDEHFAELNFTTQGEHQNCISRRTNTEATALLVQRLQTGHCSFSKIAIMVVLTGSRSRDFVFLEFERCETTTATADTSASTIFGEGTDTSTTENSGVSSTSQHPDGPSNTTSSTTSTENTVENTINPESSTDFTMYTTPSKNTPPTGEGNESSTAPTFNTPSSQYTTSTGSSGSSSSSMSGIGTGTTESSETSSSTITSTILTPETPNSTSSTIATIPPLEPGESVNLLANYVHNFSLAAQTYFDFSSTAKELHIKDVLPANTSFQLDFLPAPSQRSRRAAGSNFMLTVKVLSRPVVIVDPEPVIGTTEIILIVVGSVLLFVLLWLVIRTMKIVLMQKDTQLSALQKPPALKPTTPTVLTHNGFKNTGTGKSIRTTSGSVHEENELTTSARDRTVSKNSNTQVESDRIHLMDHESGHTEDDISIQQEPDYTEHIETPSQIFFPGEEPIKQIEDPVCQEPEPEPEPDYPLTTTFALPPPPPPPPPPFVPFEASQPILLETSKPMPRSPATPRNFNATPCSGETFMEELKNAVADPYTVLRTIDDTSRSPSDLDRKVRFDNTVEVLPSPQSSSVASSANASPALIRQQKSVKGDVDIPVSPPVPTYLTKHNLEKQTSSNIGTPSVPNYQLPIKLKTDAPEKPIVSPSPPVYIALKLTSDNAKFDPVVEEEIVSRRQISKNRLQDTPPVPPPQPLSAMPPHTMLAGTDADSASLIISPNTAEEEDEGRTSL